MIKARLEDAEFYFQEDCKFSLEHYTEKLVEVTFQEKLGTLYDKTQRIISLTKFIASELKLQDSQKIERAALLCKADLVTLMLGEKEFTKLQGYIGQIYAEKSGEDAEVCRAIYQHYLPRGENDVLPDSIISSVVAVADKIDTICGIIGIGMLPSGSKDPFALRRAANGVVQILDKFDFTLDINLLIKKAFAILNDKVDYKNISAVKTFFQQRINWLLKIKNIDYDIIESVMHIEQKFISDAVKRASALQKYKKSSSFQKLVIGFKRASNIIIVNTEFSEVDEKRLVDASEIILFKEINRLSIIITELLSGKKYEQILDELVLFGQYIDKFFDNVLVNTNDEELKKNRYNLLKKIRELFLTVADLNKIVIEK